MRLKAVVAAAVVAALLGACGSVNEDAGRPVDRSYPMLQYADDAGRPAGPPGQDSPFGTYQMQVSGTLGYLGEIEPLATTGAMTLGPGPRAGELRIAYYSGNLRFPYETQSVLVSSDASSLTAVSLVNPLDSRVSLECAVDHGTGHQQPGRYTEAHEVTGTCTGGATVRGTVTPDGRRTARWRGQPVELIRTVIDLDVSGSSSGTVHMVTETPDGSTFPLTTTLDVDVTAQGIALTEKLERNVLPRVQG